MFDSVLKRGLIIAAAMLLACVSLVPPANAGIGIQVGLHNESDTTSPPLPRWREEGTPYNPNQSMHPYAMSRPNPKDVPTSGLIETTPEYGPMRGVLFWYHSSAWASVVRDLVVGLTQDPEHDDIAYVVVTSTSQMNSAISVFSGAGADMSKVEFMIEPGNAVWIRDYGPHFIWQDSALCIVNSQYFSTRSLDNFVPELIGTDHFLMPTYDMGLSYAGGNLLPGLSRNAFMSSIIVLDNPTEEGFDENFIAELYQTYQGIDTIHIMPQLPFSVDLTGHIDMWMYIVDENTVIISEFIPGSDHEAITITDNAVIYMEALGFEVYRTPAWNANHPDNGYSTNWTYTNALRVNDRIFVSTYGETYTPYADEDVEALAVWEAAAGPEVEIIPINCYPIIWAAGAIHCIAMQVPRRTEPEPAAHVIWPDGGELFVSGAIEMITWVATDTDNDSIPAIVLYYSIDDGETYELIDTTADTGMYEWTVPFAATEEARVKVVATSQDSDEYEAVSAAPFQIAPADQAVYDFSSGAGVDRFAWGHQTASWSSIEGNRKPVTSEIDDLVSSAYDKIAYSDATGGDYDSDRYVSPDPSNGYESTHIFEFTIGELPAAIDDIGILWEGYSDNCAMMELYVWDYVEGQWCDSEGFLDQNRFMDNWAGNRDGFLEKHIRADFEHYVNVSGEFTLLLYSERGPDGYYITYNPTFHDYIAVTVSDIIPPIVCGDADDSGEVDIDDAVFLINFIFSGGQAPDPLELGDADCSGGVDIDDVVFLIAFIFSGGNVPCDTDGDSVPDC
jgi:agmatine deiminase